MSQAPDHHRADPIRRSAEGDVHFLERPGVGPTLVFLHGIGSGAQSFASVFEEFPAGPRLIAWDAPGYGASKALDVPHPNASDYAYALERLLEHLGLEAVHLVGHSLGTLIAAEFASVEPSRVLSITLAASAQGYGVESGGTLPPKVEKRLQDLEALGPEAFARTRAPGLVFEPDLNSAAVARVQSEMAKINPDGYAQAVHMLASGDLSASVERLRHTPGFIIGAEDRITPMAQTERAMQAWERAHGERPECIAIPRAGHAVYVQAPKPFIEALLTLVPDLRSDVLDFAEGEFHG